MQIFKITHERIPNIIPLAIEYVNGIIIRARKPAITSAMSPSKVIFLTDDIIIIPTKIRAGVVAKLGIAVNNGESTMAIRKSTPVVSDVRPVRPPAATPALDST